MDPQITGDNQQNVLTGQVPVGPECIQHRPTAHDAEGIDEMRWCPNCGKNDAGEAKAPGNGGWGS